MTDDNTSHDAQHPGHTDPPRHTVLLVSKPVVPPWSDSSKNLVRDVVLGSDRAAGINYVVLTDGSHEFDGPHIRHRTIYASPGRLAPGLRQNARVVGTLLRGGVDLHHFFFAPNRRTASIARLVRRIRRRPSIQTICSVPRDFSDVKRSLFADVNVTLSEYTTDRLRAQGITNVRRIPPCVPPLEAVFEPSRRADLKRGFDLPTDRPMVLFPGDYEFGGAAESVAEAALKLSSDGEGATFVFACRLKTAASRQIEASIRAKLAASVSAGRVVFMNHVGNILDLLGAADMVLLPAADTYAKMDYPLVLLEAMALGRAVVVGNSKPLSELVSSGQTGYLVDPSSPEQLVGVIEAGLQRPSELDEMGRRACEDVNRRFDRGRVAAQYLALYRELLGD